MFMCQCSEARRGKGDDCAPAAMKVLRNITLNR